MIISASRRTDIPAYYSEWFMNRLKEGYVLTRNPMNHAQISRIQLSPDIIDCIVFWTKDPKPMLEQLPLLDQMGYRYYFQFTLTPYGRDMEPNLRDKNDIMKTFMMLSETVGKAKVLWRYDPIIVNDSYTVDFHLEKIKDMCRRLSGYTEGCTISFVDLYQKLNPANQPFLREITEEEMIRLASAFAEAGKRFGISVRACCERLDLSQYGISSASCIDREAIERVCGYTIEGPKDTNQRSGCGCIQSIDIGIYNTCRNGCIYCYANIGRTSAQKNFESHDSKSELLFGAVREDDQIRDRAVKSLRNNQMKLF